jgi:hypothetical protein
MTPVRAAFLCNHGGGQVLTGAVRGQIQDFVESIADPVNRFEGNDLPVSAFEAGGRVPTGSSK